MAKKIKAMCDRIDTQSRLNRKMFETLLALTSKMEELVHPANATRPLKETFNPRTPSKELQAEKEKEYLKFVPRNSQQVPHGFASKESVPPKEPDSYLRRKQLTIVIDADSGMVDTNWIDLE